ncbi:hypothetical protein AbraIFM66950_012269 [Aspergillus brasiliensis]|nr:hypothetical protein AbraIFM66950_012269 [Aspergillus brasiliensis]
MTLRVDKDAQITFGVDFGTTYTGTLSFEECYALRKLGVRNGHDAEKLIEQWPAPNSTTMTAPKVPSIIQYNPDRWGAEVVAGSNAECSSLFKLFLEPNYDRRGDDYASLNFMIDHKGLGLPGDKTKSDERETRKVLEQIVRNAGLAPKANDILTMIPEPIAAAVAVFEQKEDTFRDDDILLICDIGGGTIDVGSVLIRQTESGRYMRQLEPTRGNRGMLSVETAFYRTMVSRFRDAFKTQDVKAVGPSSALIRAFRKYFENFTPESLEQQGWVCRLPLKIPLMGDNPGIYDRSRKQIILSARDIQAFLDPVVDMAVSLITEQRRIVAGAGFGKKKEASHIYLVGGGAENAYVLRSVRTRMRNEQAVDVSAPDRPQVAVVRGAAVYGLDDVLSIHRCPQYIGFECPQEYHADRHDQPQPGLRMIRDPVDGRQMVTGAAVWVLDMGRIYHEGAVETENVTEYFLDGKVGDRHKNIFVSRNPRPPVSVTGLTPSSAIEIHFRQVPAVKMEARQVDGRRQIRICYEISTTFLPIDNRIEFVARVNNQEIGRQAMNMPMS